MATEVLRESGISAARARRDRRAVTGVYLALLSLLAITIGITFFDLGWINVAANLTIAMIKTALVLWFFMHLREMGPVLRFFAVAAAVWLAILFGFTLSDWLTRGG